MDIENTIIIEGLSLSGTVSQRSKKYIGENRMEVVTYLVTADNSYYFLDEFMPQDYYKIGDKISVPVNCRPFARKNNRLGIAFTVRKDRGITLTGEDF